MDEYLKNISNLEEDLIAFPNGKRSPGGGTPVVQVPSTPPQITESSVVSEQKQDSSGGDNYLSPEKIIVKKYRLKK